MSSVIELINEILIGRPDGNVSAELRLTGKIYPVSQFSISFSQGVDQFGEPQSETYGGRMLVSIPMLPDSQILNWSSGSRVLKNGEIVFKNETESTSLRIVFENAYCICLREDVFNGSECSFTISPQKVFLNDQMLDNDWD